MRVLRDVVQPERATGLVVAMVLLAALTAGCVRPLAVQDDFFSPLNGTAAAIAEQTRHAVGHRRALQAARHRCPTPIHTSGPSGETRHAEGPDLGLAAEREALAELCRTAVRPPVAAYGATSEAYRRWAEDRVRKLPEAAETGAGAAGGS